MNVDENEKGLLKHKVTQFYVNGSFHQDLVDFINDANTLQMCFEFYTDTNQCIKHFGITGLINKIKKQLMTDAEFEWLNNQVDQHFYNEQVNLLYFVKMVAYLKLSVIAKSTSKSIMATLSNLPKTNQQCVKRNQILISSMFEIISSRDLAINVLTIISALLHQESVTILSLVIDLAQGVEDTVVQQCSLKTLAFLYNYSPDSCRPLARLQEYVINCVVVPDLFAEAVDLLTSILGSSNLSNHQMEQIIRFTLMQNPVVAAVIRDQKEAVASGIEWRDRDNSEKQIAYALCEYLGSLINMSLEALVALFTERTKLACGEKEALEYLIQLLLQLLSIEGDIPKYNDIFIGIINNVHILLEELSEVTEEVYPVVLSFQRNLLDIFFEKLKHPFSYGSTDFDMEEFLDNRDNVNYAFESMNLNLLADWLKQKLLIFSQASQINVSDMETVFFFYSEMPDMPGLVMPFEQLHRSVFQRGFLAAGASPQLQETVMDSYLSLLRELFYCMNTTELDLLVEFIWDILTHYKPASVSAAGLLSSIYHCDRIQLSSIESSRETRTLLLIKQLVHEQQQQQAPGDVAAAVSCSEDEQWREYSITLYGIVGRLSCLCSSNEQITNLSAVFINPLFQRISATVDKIVAVNDASSGDKPPAICQQQQANGSGPQPVAEAVADNPDENVISHQLSLISSFLGPHSKFPNNCHQFVSELITALLDQLYKLASLVIESVEFHSALRKLCHCVLHDPSLCNGGSPASQSLIPRLLELVMRHCSVLYSSYAGRHRAACLEVAISTLHCFLQHLTSHRCWHSLTAALFAFFCQLLLDYTFNRFPSTPNYYMPAFICRCLHLLHSTLTQHGPPHPSPTLATSAPGTGMSSACNCLDYSPNLSRPNLPAGKLAWLADTSPVLAQLHWVNLFFVPAFYLGDLTHDVNLAASRLLIAAVRAHRQLPPFIHSALLENLQLVMFNIVKLLAFGITEQSELVALIGAIREHAITEAVQKLALVISEPVVRSNSFLLSVARLVHHLLTTAKLNNSQMRQQIANFQESVRHHIIQPMQSA